MTKIEKIKIPKDEAYGGNVYEGEVFDGVPHGQGTMTHPDGQGTPSTSPG